MPNSENNYDVDFTLLLVVPNESTVDFQFALDDKEFHSAFDDTAERN